MRRETAIAQILLILSVSNFALAAPAVVQQRHLNRNFLAPESLDDSPPKSPPGLSHHDWVPEPRIDPPSSSSSPDLWPPTSPAVSYEDGPPYWNYWAHPYRPVRWWQQVPLLNSDSAPASLSGSSPPSEPVGSMPESGSDPAGSANSPVAAAPLMHDGSSPVAAAPLTHDGSSQVTAVPSAHGDPAPEPGDPPSHHDSAPESSAMTPEANRFFNDGLKQKIKVLGVAIGVVGAVYGINQIKDKVSSRAYVSPLFPRSPANVKPSHKHFDLISSSVKPLVGTLQVLMSSAVPLAHTPNPVKNPVSRGLANLRVKDVRLLSVSLITHRARESFI